MHSTFLLSSVDILTRLFRGCLQFEVMASRKRNLFRGGNCRVSEKLASGNEGDVLDIVGSGPRALIVACK